MAKQWDINDDSPARDEKYEWQVPNLDQEHVLETTAPGDLLIKPKDMALVPRNPTGSSGKNTDGIQQGHNSWTTQSGVDSTWYVFGQVVQDND